jgi:hypothetical protein
MEPPRKNQREAVAMSRTNIKTELTQINSVYLLLSLAAGHSFSCRGKKSKTRYYQSG